MENQLRALELWRRATIGAVLLLFTACIGDYLTVRSPRYPGNSQDYALPAVMTAIVIVLVANYLLARRVGASVLISALTFAIYFVLAITCGMAFHFSIGGTK